MKNPTLLLDADVPCHRIAFRNQENFDWDDDGNEDIVTHDDSVIPDVEQYLDSLKKKFNTEDIVIALSGSNNYRKELYPDYKSKRTEKPKLWAAVREYLEHGDHGYMVKVKDRLEGDDVLGIMATHPRWRKNHIVITIDKDLQTVPCNLYLENKPELGVVPIDPDFAKRFFMTQILTGDSVDCYPGCPGIGAVRAEKILLKEDIQAKKGWGSDLSHYWEPIVAAYESKGLTEEDALVQARLAYILQHGDYNNKTGEINLWKP